VTVNVQKASAVVLYIHHVAIPDFVEHCPRLRHPAFSH
jgi:hypothetical protein